MFTYYCHLGNTPELSLRELEALLPSTELNRIFPTVVAIQLADDAATVNLLEKAGGVVKIYRELTTIPSTNIEKIVSAIADFLLTKDSGKVTFGLSQFGQQSLPIDESDIKKALKERNRPSRYVDTTAPYGVAAAVLLKNAAREISLLNTKTDTIVVTTIATQDINDWTKRDRNKPYADHKKGMLPPKVARMLVNIGLSLTTLPPKDITLYDPFCGSGTILMEALFRGVTVLGSDLDPQSVVGTTDNLEWLTEEYNLSSPFSVFQRDAAQRQTNSTNERIDLIVTEPFLGKPTPQEHELSNIFRGLHRLYLGVFKNWSKMLKDGTFIVIIFPVVKTKHHTFSLEELIDKLTDLGYSIASQPIVYGRPQAIVQRQIQFFRLTRSS